MSQVTFNTRLSLTTAQALDALAASTGKSKASIVEAALMEYIKREGKSKMEKYDVFKSQGGYGVALGIYLESPVVGSIRWFESKEDAEEYAANKRRYDKDCADFDAKIPNSTMQELEKLSYPNEKEYGLDKGTTI